MSVRPQFISWPVQIGLSLALVGAIWLFIQLVPMDEELVEHGVAFSEAGQPELALRSYEQALQENPDNIEAQFQRAVALSQLGREDEALTIIEALEDYPRPALLDIQMGWILYEQDEMERATDHFSEAAAIISQDDVLYTADHLGNAYAGLGWTVYESGGCEVAAPFFQQAIDAAPTLPDALRGIERCDG